MKRFFALFGLLVITFPVFSQVGNEWINPGQPYYKIPVGKNGIYRLDYTLLEFAGLPVNSIDPTTFQLFHRGVEQAIYLEGETDNQFNTTDFIEFYGQQNDGTLDKELYQPASIQPHNYYNLYSDTTYYFLTFGAVAGKRMSFFQEDNTDGTPAELYHLDEKLMVLTSEYAPGNNYYSDVLHAYYDEGEGFTGPLIVNVNFKEIRFTNISNTHPAGGLPQLELLLVGRSNDVHQMEIYVGNGLRLLTTISWSGYSNYSIKQNIEWSDIAADGTLLVRVKGAASTTTGNLGSVSFARLQYPQTFSGAITSDKVFALNDKANNNFYIELPGATAGLQLFDITSSENCIRIGATTPIVTAKTPAGTGRKILASVATAQPRVIPVSFRNINPANHNYIIVTHSSLRQPGGAYADPVKAYAEYRASAAGGGYDTLIMDIQQLYDQFSYGEITPTAIYRFMRYFTNIHTPDYLFIIGKGLMVNYRYHRNPGAYPKYKDLVPTSGYPGSDAIFTAGLQGTTYEPAVPTGRITASLPADVAAYLDKVKEAEARPFNDLRRKNILHLSGGVAPGEPERFKSYLQEFATIAEDYYLGGHVDEIAKQSFDLELINIADEVNAGLGLVTFYGHSSATQLDFDIGYVSDPVMGYDNQGKYPIMLMNGCNIGANFLNNVLFGEDWILTPDKGAIGFIAHTNFGFEQNLRRYADLFYRVAFSDSSFMGKGIGDIQKEVAKRYIQGSLPSPSNITQIQEMMLLGDPAVPLFGSRKPDLEITSNDISVYSLNEEPVTAQSDSFAIKIIVRNYGMARQDTIQVQIKRYLNDNTLLIYDSLFSPVKYSDTLTFIIRKGRENAGGNNTFEITLDPDDVITEIRNDNNTASIGIPIPLNGTKNLFPSKFGIVHNTSISLAFQATDVFSDERGFLIELDTVSTFDSPFKKEFTTTAQVLSKQSIQLLTKDSTAYYWRTKLKDVLPGESDEWALSSFTYIENGPEGWAQIRFQQYAENPTEGLVKDATLQALKFEASTTPVTITTYGIDHVTTNKDVSVKIDNIEYHIQSQGYTCRDNSINLIAFNKHSTAPYPGVYMTWYNRANRACGRLPWVINNYRYNEMAVGNGSDLIAYVNNVEAGDSVVLFSIGNANYTLWPVAAKTKLGELGISTTQLSTLINGEPIIIFGKKGSAPGSAKIFLASGTPAKAQPLQVDKTITGAYTTGSMTTVTIGPAQEWQSFIAHPNLTEGNDETSFDIIGIKLNGDQVLLNTVSSNYDLTGVSASEYPYLKIKYHVSDPVNSTPAQLKHWFVLYTPVPEGLLLKNGSNEQVTIQEGQPWSEDYNFINVSDRNFSDSLTVDVDVFNLNTRQFDHQHLKIKAPEAGDTTSFMVNVNSVNKTGLNDISVNVNPRVLPEQHYDNNTIALYNYLQVESDNINPVMDVTIDGRYLLNNDFVSADPVVRMQLWDENPYILKETPDGIRIFLTYPCDVESCDPTSIELTSEDIEWHAATTTTPFTLYFTPTNLPAGHYSLRIEGADSRGNTSGLTPYEIEFNVSGEDQLTISEVYPNPTTGEINFTVILEGNTLPENFTIDIMDMQGRVVSSQVISSHQFFIGTNRITWAMPANNWPSGLYIYRINTALNQTTANTFGKVVLAK